MPDSVPPVPMPATKQVTRPPVCSQISGAVVSWWARGFAGLPYWSASQPPGVSCAIRAARLMTWRGSSRGSPPGVSTTSAPYARSAAIFSAAVVSGTTMSVR